MVIEAHQSVSDATTSSVGVVVLTVTADMPITLENAPKKSRFGALLVRKSARKDANWS